MLLGEINVGTGSSTTAKTFQRLQAPGAVENMRAHATIGIKGEHISYATEQVPSDRLQKHHIEFMLLEKSLSRWISSVYVSAPSTSAVT